MKKINIFILAIFLFLAGCTDSLKEPVFGVVDELTTVTNIRAATISIYQAVEQGGGNFQTTAFFPMTEVGHRYSSFGNNGEGFGNVLFYKYLFVPTSNELNLTWSALYRMVNRSNEVIEAAQTAIPDTTIANPLIAEARFLRGWAYFVLTQFWGDVPLHLKATASSSDQESIYLPRAPVAAVYAQILADLKYAAEIFPNGATRLPKIRPTADLGRVTSGSALALLGKVYLTMAGKPLENRAAYQDAINTFKILVSQNVTYGTGLLPKGSYRRIFEATNEMNAEVLFALRAFANTSFIASGSYTPSLMTPRFANVDTDTYAETGQYGLRWDILRLFEHSDVRSKEGVGGSFPDMRASSVITVAGIQTRDSMVYDTLTRFQYMRKSLPTSVVTGPALSPTRYGLGYTKWRADVARATTNPRTYNNDWIVLRYADVLLSYAEALNEVGQTSEAIQFLNQVRARANASLIEPTTGQTALRKILREERTRELIGEFTTVFDMRRWGTVKEEMDNYRLDQLLGVSVLPVYSEKFNLYPIPFAQIVANPRLVQNKGW